MNFGGGGIGPQGMALMQAALRMNAPQAAPGGGTGGAPMPRPGILSQFMPGAPGGMGGANGILAKLRALQAGGMPGAAPMSLAPPGMAGMMSNNIGPQQPMAAPAVDPLIPW